MLTKVQMQQMLETDPDFISIRRYGYSLAKLEGRYPDGVPDHVLATALLLTTEEMNSRYHQIVLTLRNLMRIEV